MAEDGCHGPVLGRVAHTFGDSPWEWDDHGFPFGFTSLMRSGPVFHSYRVRGFNRQKFLPTGLYGCNVHGEIGDSLSTGFG